MRSSIALAVCFAAFASPAVRAQGYDIYFGAPNVAAPAGSVVSIPIDLQNGPQAVTGFSFGVRHDAANLTFESMDLGASLQAVLPGSTPDQRFFQVNALPTGGVTVAMILSADSAAVSLPAGTHRIFDGKYRLLATGTGPAALSIAGDLGTPPVPVIIDLNGTAQAPTVTTNPKTMTVTFSSGGAAPFVRGDADQTGRLSVTDAIIILDYLFGGAALEAGQPTYTNCPQLMNADGTVGGGTDPLVEDRGDIDLSDPIYLLTFLFRLGALPPAPFPQCGSPPPGTTDPAFVCQAFNCPAG